PVCVCGNKCLIRGDNGLACIESVEDQLAWVIDATDNFHNQVHVIACNQCTSIISNEFCRNTWAVFFQIRYCDTAYLNWAADSLRVIIRMLSQQTKYLGANCAKAQKRNAYWLPFTLACAVEILDGRRHAYSPKLRVVRF